MVTEQLLSTPVLALKFYWMSGSALFLLYAVVFVSALEPDGMRSFPPPRGKPWLSNLVGVGVSGNGVDCLFIAATTVVRALQLSWAFERRGG